MLALCCEHGKQEDISNILRLMKFYGKPLATSTFNILLNQCVQEDNTMKAGGILKKMANENILPDTITYHTLLKLYVRQNDQVAVDKVSNLLVSLLFQFSASSCLSKIPVTLQDTLSPVLALLLFFSVVFFLLPLSNFFTLLYFIDTYRNATTWNQSNYSH